MNTNMKNKPSRRSIRLPDYDYSNCGWYYVTICTQNRKCMFGDIENGKMVLNGYGKIVENIWKTLPDQYPVELDEFQIMPNHLHSIIQIVGAGFMPARSNKRVTTHKNTRRGLIHQTQTRIHQTQPKFGQWMGMINHAPTLGHIIRYLKAKSSRLTEKKLWQRNFYEHIIRNEKSLNKIKTYIKNNPNMWHRDKNNPKNIRITRRVYETARK